MADWYDNFRDMHDQGLTGSPAQRVAKALLSPDIPSERMEMQSGATEGRGKQLFRFQARWLLVPLFLWLMGYISGLFPYLGAYAYNNGNGDITYSLQTPSPRIMPLFKGQVAFIDYKFEPRPGSDSRIYLDIRPWPGLAPSSHRMVISDRSSGRLAVPITRTDYYQFSFSSASGVKSAELYYSVKWGAR